VWCAVDQNIFFTVCWILNWVWQCVVFKITFLQCAMDKFFYNLQGTVPLLLAKTMLRVILTDLLNLKYMFTVYWDFEIKLGCYITSFMGKFLSTASCILFNQQHDNAWNHKVNLAINFAMVVAQSSPPAAAGSASLRAWPSSGGCSWGNSSLHGQFSITRSNCRSKRFQEQCKECILRNIRVWQNRQVKRLN